MTKMHLNNNRCPYCKQVVNMTGPSDQVRVGLRYIVHWHKVCSEKVDHKDDQFWEDWERLRFCEAGYAPYTRANIVEVLKEMYGSLDKVPKKLRPALHDILIPEPKKYRDRDGGSVNYSDSSKPYRTKDRDHVVDDD